MGVGGSAAEAVSAAGSEEAFLSSQVICVTHLPQIAGFADHHYYVEKHASKGRTYASIQELSTEARPAEIGRMLSGACDHARRLCDYRRAAPKIVRGVGRNPVPRTTPCRPPWTQQRTRASALPSAILVWPVYAAFPLSFSYPIHTSPLRLERGPAIMNLRSFHRMTRLERCRRPAPA